MPVAEPQKELRFTRAGQALPFMILAAVAFMAALVLPLVLAVVLVRVAWRCARHAYILLSPIGVEIFPFFRPAAGMQVIPWAQIVAAEVDDSRLTLHFTEEKTAGIHLSLAPLSKDRRELLARAIRGRLPEA